MNFSNQDIFHATLFSKNAIFPGCFAIDSLLLWIWLKVATLLWTGKAAYLTTFITEERGNI